MTTDHVARAVEYYTFVGAKNVEGIKKYLHPEVEFYSPLAVLKGKEAVVQATSHYMNVIESLTIRAQFGAGDQAVIIYDVDIPGIATGFPAAVLLSFRDGLIARSELFFDASRFLEKR